MCEQDKTIHIAFWFLSLPEKITWYINLWWVKQTPYTVTVSHSMVDRIRVRQRINGKEGYKVMKNFKEYLPP